MRVTGQINMTTYDRLVVENDKIRQLGRDKFCAEAVGRISPRWNFGQADGANADSECRTQIRAETRSSAHVDLARLSIAVAFRQRVDLAFL